MFSGKSSANKKKEVTGTLNWMQGESKYRSELVQSELSVIDLRLT